jgi:hypothetical protein
MADIQAPRWFVRYYCPRMSKRGQGVQVRHFVNRAEAEEFAAKNRLYSRPAKVEEVEILK